VAGGAQRAGARAGTAAWSERLAVPDARRNARLPVLRVPLASGRLRSFAREPSNSLAAWINQAPALHQNIGTVEAAVPAETATLGASPPATSANRFL
jgi:hypothetical protein